MTRTIKLTKGFSALLLLTALLVVVPLALWHYVGWPLPHSLPSWSQFTSALNQRGIPDQILLKVLACVVWISWGILATSVLVEVPAAVRGRAARRMALAGPIQPLVMHLVAAILVAALAALPRATSGEPARLAAALPYGRPSQPAMALALSADVTPGPAPAFATDASPGAIAATTTYVIQRGDTLWGIAERQLGDPLRWSEIYQLNEGKPQPGGVTLSDPHWIDPGWTLVLPAPSAPSVPPPAAPAPTPPSEPTAPAPTAASPLATMPTTTVPAEPPHPAPAPAHHTATSPRTEHAGEPVRLPSGSVVAGSFAAGVAATIAIGRLRRRHAYRYRPPRPANTWASEGEHPAVTQLRLAAAPDDDSDEFAAPQSPVDDVERHQRPDLVEIGLRDGVAVTVELTELSGLALEGRSADDAVRALIDALLVHAGPGAAEVLVPEALATRLLPGLGAQSAVRRSATLGQVATALEAERVMRSRWLEEAGASDAKVFRTQHPEHPLPMLLAVVEMSPQDPTSGQWAALARGASRLGMSVLFLGASPEGSTTVRLDESRRVLNVEPDDGLAHLLGVELFGLQADEAVAVLSAVGEAEASGLENPDELREESDHDADSPDHQQSQGIDDTWQVAEEREVRPVTVRMFGHLEIAAGGEVIASGLRARARDLLAWYMLHPSGSTSNEAVEALWPDTEPDRVHAQFWRSFSDLRTCLRNRSGADLEVLAKVGEHYRAVVSEINCDLWTFQAALSETVAGSDTETTRVALRRAVDAYRGEFLIGDDRPWVEPVRQNLHRRSLDAHLRLAELEEEAGQTDAAVELLERAIERDRYAEEPYRRLMALHGSRGRGDAIRDVWLMLHARVAELDLDVEDATASLYYHLTASAVRQAHPRRMSSLS